MFDRRQRFINLPANFIDAAVEYEIDDRAADAGPAINTMLAQVSAAAREAGQETASVWLPPGDFNVATSIVHPINVTVWGAGPNATRINQVGNIPLWTFANAFCRSELAYVSLLGQGSAGPAARVNTGIDLDQSTYCNIHHVQVWDFLVGINVSSGLVFSAYHDVSNFEVNRCTTGVRCLDNANSNSVRNGRIFYSFGAADEGIGIDVDDASALEIEQIAVESADTCVRIRNTTGQTRTSVRDCYLEPGTNDFTTTVGQAYDIDIDVVADGEEIVRLEANRTSSLGGTVSVDPEGFHVIDTYSRYPFGARFDGAALPKRNLLRNGYFNYYNAALIPAWATGGTAPTIAENTVDQVTGVRCLQITANDATSVFQQSFLASDQGSGWVTMGFRYQVLAGNVGFTMSVTVGGGSTSQWTDFTPDPGVWKVGYVQVRIGAASRIGTAIIQPDAVGGSGAVLIDEVWCVPGRYAIPSTQYGERIELLQAPIPIHVQAPVVITTVWGPVNILDLPAALGAPLDDFSAAPEGVIGCVLRGEIYCSGAASDAALPDAYFLEIDIPAAGAIIAADTHNIGCSHGQTAYAGEVTVRDTSVSGRFVLGGALGTGGQITLVAWVLQ